MASPYSLVTLHHEEGRREGGQHRAQWSPSRALLNTLGWYSYVQEYIAYHSQYITLRSHMYVVLLDGTAIYRNTSHTTASI